MEIMQRAARAAARATGGRHALREAARDALAIVAPTSCSGCGRADRALCDSCAAELRASPLTVHSVGPAESFGSPHPPGSAGPPDALEVYCALEYSGVARRVLLALKETGRTDAAARLAPALLAVADAAIRGSRPGIRSGVELVIIPSTRQAFRHRGYHPMRLVLAAAGLRASRVIRAARQTADQSALDAQARRRNRTGSLRARGSLRGRVFVVVDDILTTGATIVEARRAIESAGGTVLAGAVIAYTRRHFPAGSSKTGDSLPIAGDLSATGHYG